MVRTKNGMKDYQTLIEFSIKLENLKKQRDMVTRQINQLNENIMGINLRLSETEKLGQIDDHPIKSQEERLESLRAERKSRRMELEKVQSDLKKFESTRKDFQTKARQMFASDISKDIQRLEEGLRMADEANKRLKEKRSKISRHVTLPYLTVYSDYTHHGKRIIETGKEFIRQWK